MSDDVYLRTADNRRLIADVLEGLSEVQLDTPSLCGEWTVRDVAGHLVMPLIVGVPELLREAVRYRSLHRASVRVSHRIASRPVNELAATLRRHADRRFSAPIVGPMGQLADTSIHLRDMARPLGLSACAPVDDWRLVLDFLVSRKARAGFVATGTLSGLSLAATDQAWTWGDGAVVTGPSEALALALTGRRVALDDLAGAGVRTLRTRLPQGRGPRPPD